MDPVKKFQERMKIILSLGPGLTNVGPPPLPPGFSATPLAYDTILEPPPYVPETAYNSTFNPPPPPLPDMPLSTVFTPTIQSLYPAEKYPYIYPPQNNPQPPSFILIFSDNTTYDALASEIERLAADIHSDLGVTVDVFHENYNHAYDVQAILKRYATDASKKLLGSILIG